MHYACWCSVLRSPALLELQLLVAVEENEIYDGSSFATCPAFGGPHEVPKYIARIYRPRLLSSSTYPQTPLHLVINPATVRRSSLLHH